MLGRDSLPGGPLRGRSSSSGGSSLEVTWSSPSPDSSTGEAFGFAACEARDQREPRIVV